MHGSAASRATSRRWRPVEKRRRRRPKYRPTRATCFTPPSDRCTGGGHRPARPCRWIASTWPCATVRESGARLLPFHQTVRIIGGANPIRSIARISAILPYPGARAGTACPGPSGQDLRPDGAILAPEPRRARTSTMASSSRLRRSTPREASWGARSSTYSASDTQSQPQIAKALAVKAIDDGAYVVMGPVFSGSILVSMAETRRAEVPNFTGGEAAGITQHLPHLVHAVLGHAESRPLPQ
jgi:hypothetical protein